MTDIMELIERYRKECIRFTSGDNYNKENEIWTELESRISAMQEVVDAAVKNCTGIDCYCPLCEAINKYKDVLK